MSSPRNRPPLDRATIVAEATAFADDEGSDAISMRRLADRLGFKVMALYNHVANKDELLRLMTDAVAAEIPAPSPEDAPLVGVRRLAVDLRAALVRHPWAAALWNRHVPGPDRIVLMEHLLRILAASGLPHDLAHHGFHAVTNHVLGYTLQEQAMTLDQNFADDPQAVARDFVDGLDPEEFPHTVAHVHEHLEGHTESSFPIVLDLILDGLVGLAAPD